MIQTRAQKARSNSKELFHRRLLDTGTGLFIDQCHAEQTVRGTEWTKRYPEIIDIAKYCLTGDNKELMKQAVATYQSKKKSENDQASSVLQRIQEFVTFRPPAEWSQEQRDAFAMCRTKAFLYTDWQQYKGVQLVEDFQAWHGEYWNVKDGHLHHAWLAGNPLFRVYWQWLRDGIPPQERHC